MVFNPSIYQGMKITKIEAYLNTDTKANANISDTQIFMAKNLTNTGTVSFATYDVTPTETVWGTYTGDEVVSVMSCTLDQPYEITSADPFYIGYNMKVNSTPGTAERYPILLDGDVANPDAFYFKSSYSEFQWTNDRYSSGAAIIVVTLEREINDFDLGFLKVGTTYAEAGKNFDVMAQVVNGGANPVTTITYTYALNDGEATTNTINLEEPLAPNFTDVYDVLLPIEAIDQVDIYTLNLNITQIDGQPNESKGASTSAELHVYPYIPQHRPLVEEYTALECGWCPRGYAAMEYISDEYTDEAVVICYHTPNFGSGSDPMAVTGVMPVATNNYPTASIDRMGIVDPYYGSSNKNLGIVDEMFERAGVVAFADINIADVIVSLPDSVINVKTDVTFMKNVNNDSYRIGYVLSCDGLRDPSWKQANSFSKKAEYKNAPLLEEFYILPGTVYGLTFNDVAIITKDMRGVANSLVDVVPGETITNEYSFDVKNVKNYHGTSLNPYLAIHRMWVNAFVVDRVNGQVVNAVRFPVRNVFSSVESVEGDANVVVSVEYFDLTGCRVANPAGGIFIRSEKMADGSVKTSKVLLK